MTAHLQALSILPMLPPLWVLFQLLYSNDVGRLKRVDIDATNFVDGGSLTATSVGGQLLVFLALGVIGHLGTHRLIPSIQYYMLKRGICGKDLGKKGTQSENDDM